MVYLGTGLKELRKLEKIDLNLCGNELEGNKDDLGELKRSLKEMKLLKEMELNLCDNDQLNLNKTDFKNFEKELK